MMSTNSTVLFHRRSRAVRPRCVGTYAVSIAAVAVASLIGACGGESERVSCVVTVGGKQTTVSLEVKVGSSSIATLGSYSVTFSILDHSQLQAEVRDAHSTLMTSKATGAVGGGSAGTPDGLLEYSCAP